MQIWHGLLAQILDQLVLSRSGSPDLQFWETVIKHEPNGSGEGHFAGWMSTFNVFTTKGEWQATDFTISSRRNGQWVEDQSTWPVLDPDELSRGMCKVPVEVQEADGTWYMCYMFAGTFRSDILNKNTLVPRNDWCIATKR